MVKTTRRRFIIGSGMGVAATVLPQDLYSQERSSILAAHLLCDKQQNPVGIDIPSPRLSWQVVTASGSISNLKQTAYQVLVASTPKLLSRGIGDRWDSGRVASSQSVLLPYAGKPFKDFEQSWWKVRLWDQDGHRSSWSEPATVELGIVDPDLWKAHWIEAPSTFLKQHEPSIQQSIPLGKWIWPVSQSRAYLRKFFDLPQKQLVRALMETHCENEFHVFLNGQAVAVSQYKEGGESCAVDVTKAVRERDNFWGVQAYQSDNPHQFSAALRAGLQLEFSDGTMQHVLSDGSWQFGIMGSYFQNADPKDWQLKPSVGSWSDGTTAVEIHPRLLRHSLYLRREFSLQSPARSARVYATARGLYELRLNGKPIRDVRLAPGCMNKAQYYQTYDVTDSLHEGKNILAAITGSGWLNSRYYGDMFAHQLQFLAYLRMELADGSLVELGTGPEWKLQLSALRDNDLQWGERYDARKELPGWEMPGYDDGAWVAAAIATPPVLPPLRAQPFEDIEVTAEHKALSIKSVSEDMHLFDFGRNQSGRVRLVLTNTKPGQLVVIKYGERLDADGLVQDDVYSDVFYPDDNNWKTGRARFMTRNLDTYVCRGADREVYEPHFTYTGFRYGQLSSWSGRVDLETFTQVAFHTDYPKTGIFTCANEAVNSIGSAIQLAMQNNHHSGPTDCPTREKNFWNGDANVFCETACWYGDMSQLYSEWTINGRKVPSRDVAWIDEIITLPWMMYVFYGDRRPAAEAYSKMAELVDGRLARSKDGLYTGEGETAIGDHVSLDPVPLPFFVAAIHSQSLQRLVQIAAMLGKTADSQRYRTAAAAAAAAFNRAFVAGDGNLTVNPSQSATVMPLAFEILRPEHRASIAQALLASVRKHDYHPTTGFVCTPLLLPMVTEYASVDDAWRLITQQTQPSWGFMLKSGSTTITETWAAQTAAVGTGTSMDHFALGSVGRWFFEYLGGIRLDFSRPAFQNLIIKPYLPSQLPSASVNFASVRGPIVSEWKKQRSEITWHVSIPPNTRAELYIPCTNPATLREGRRRASVRTQPTSEKDRVKVEIGSGDFTYTWND